MLKILRGAGAAPWTSAAMLACAVVLTPVAALALPATTQMTCTQASILVRTAGGVVLATSPTTYDRYVSGRRFCAADQAVDPAWVPTRTTPQCFVGYTCYDMTRDAR